MQKIRYFIVALLFASIVSAQSELWPTANAEWHYGISSMSINGFVKVKIDRDTLIDGKNCQIYTREYKWKNIAIPIYEDSVFQGVNDSWFILNVEDSVLYAFNKYRSQFDTILNFKAEIGDRWKFYQNFDVCSNDTNAHILIELTGKSTEVVNGENLLTFSTKKISTEEEIEFHGNDDIFYQKIGLMERYFVPRFCYGVSEYPQVSLRCFTQNKGLPNEFSYYRGSVGCESVSQLNVKNVKNVNELKNINFKVEKDYLHIQGVENENFEVSFVDLTGKVILKASNQHQIDIRGLKGLVVVQLNTENGSKVVKFNFM